MTAVLLGTASVGAIVQSANASDFGRLGAFGAVLVLAGVAYGVLRGRTWAFGMAFLLGICWFWATVALTAQGSFSAFQLGLWLAWSIVVIVASVRMRAAG